MPALDGWLAGLFAPENLETTITALWESQPADVEGFERDALTRVMAECDAKLERYRAALESGTDPALIADWTAEVQARRAEALAARRPAKEPSRMSRDEIENLVGSMISVRDVLASARPEDKADVYRNLGLHLTYFHADARVRAQVEINPSSWGYGACPRGEMTHNPNLVHRADLGILDLTG